MLIVFVATQGGTEEAPALRDLHVQDSSTNAHVPVAGLDGWDNDYMQAQIVTKAPCEFSDEESFTSADDTDKYWCRRLSIGLIHATFSVSGANAVVKILRYDKNGIETVSSDITLTAGSRQDSDSHYMAPIYEFDLQGANKIALEVVSVSSGTVYIRQAGV